MQNKKTILQIKFQPGSDRLNANLFCGRWPLARFRVLPLRGAPEPVDGWLTAPDMAGVGLARDRDALRDVG